MFLRRWQEASQVFAIFNFGTRDSELILPLETGLWTKVLDSEERRWKVKPAVVDSPSANILPRTILSNGPVTLVVPGKALALFLKQELLRGPRPTTTCTMTKLLRWIHRVGDGSPDWEHRYDSESEP